jgi:hypothetical protein
MPPHPALSSEIGGEGKIMGDDGIPAGEFLPPTSQSLWEWAGLQNLVLSPPGYAMSETANISSTTLQVKKRHLQAKV